jgi:D-alanine-D-alanine ligase
MKTIAIVAGGNSSEHVISVKSAAQVSKEIEKTGYKSHVVQIKGQDWKVEEAGKAHQIDKNDFSFTKDGQKIKFDCVLILIHGTPGEDGKLQSYFELLGLPYTSCGILASALTFNKYACKVFLDAFGVKSAKAVIVKDGKWNADEIINKLGLPCFVKPNESGSSFGVTKVTEKAQLEQAIKEAIKESSHVIIEEFIKGTEVSCGVLKTSAKQIVFPITEIVCKKEFFDYQAKYTDGFSEEITPARISNDIASKIQSISSNVYDALDCKGIVRIDYIIKDNEPYFLEVNTVPGMSENSIIPKQISTLGMTIPEIYKLIIEDLMKN